jgi:phage tail sheath protein FI
MAEYLSPGVYVEEIEMGAKPIEGVSTSTAGFIGLSEKGDEYLNKPTLVTSWGQYVDKFGRYTIETPYLSSAVHGFFQNGGSRCFIVKVASGQSEDETNSNIIGTDSGNPGTRTGLQSFIEIDAVNIICAPGITDNAVQKALIIHCENMQDRFCILDAPEDANMTAIQAHKNGIVSTKGYAALYYPWIEVAVEIGTDKTITVGGEEITETKITFERKFVPPSGYMAGIFARSDTQRGVHKAPANEMVKGALSLQTNIGKGEQDILNPLGINCIRSFQGRGILVWGAKTTASDPLWKYINIRRLFLYLEESIDESTQWIVFEPNSEILWDRVVQTIDNFLKGVWKSGALMGTTPEEAFFVKCDRTTMTQDDIDNGRLIAVIGVAPVKPAEFVIFKIAQWTNNSE